VRVRVCVCVSVFVHVVHVYQGRTAPGFVRKTLLARSWRDRMHSRGAGAGQKVLEGSNIACQVRSWRDRMHSSTSGAGSLKERKHGAL